MTDNTMLSRSGRTDPTGKLTRRLDIPVSEEMEDHISALAVIAGMSKAEFVRRELERMVYGSLSMVQRIGSQAGIGQWDESRSQAR